MNTPAAQHSLPQFDDAGLLIDPAQWNAQLAQEIANQYEIGPLTGEHWAIIRALRDHFARFGVAPAMQNVCRNLGRGRGWVHDHFHSCLNAWRVAGLPNPGEEAKSYLSGT